MSNALTLRRDYLTPQRRTIIAVEQTRPAPAGYPRPWGQMKKRPL